MRKRIARRVASSSPQKKKRKKGNKSDLHRDRAEILSTENFSPVFALAIFHTFLWTVRRISVFSHALCERRGRRNNEGKEARWAADRERLAIPNPSFPYCGPRCSHVHICTRLCNAKESLPSQRGITILTREFNVPRSLLYTRPLVCTFALIITTRVT